MPSCRGSPQTRDQIQVSRTAGRFLTVWATREAQEYWGEQPTPSLGELPDSGIEWGLPHNRRILYQLSYQGIGKPRNCVQPQRSLVGHRPWGRTESDLAAAAPLFYFYLKLLLCYNISYYLTVCLFYALSPTDCKVQEYRDFFNLFVQCCIPIINRFLKQ